jgi:hypothetical protein
LEGKEKVGAVVGEAVGATLGNEVVGFDVGNNVGGSVKQHVVLQFRTISGRTHSPLSLSN